MVEVASTSWLDDITIDRLSQRSNTYIRMSEDKTRIDQIVDACANGTIGKAFKQDKGYRKVLEYNILRKELCEIRKVNKVITRTPVEIPMGKNILQVIDGELHHQAQLDANDQPLGPQSALVIIHWVLTKQHADSLQDWLAAWAQDTTLYKNLGTVFTFTSDESLFIEPLRRLASTASIPVGSDSEIRCKLTTIANQAKALNLKVDEKLVQAARGLNLHQAETAALKGIFIDDKRQFQTSTFSDLKIQILESANLTFIEPKDGWDTIGSYDYLKKEMQDFVVEPLHNPEKTAKYGLGIPRGIILHGPPGTGKTMFAKACAKALGIPMIHLTPSDLYRGIVGESEGRIKHLTELIESLAPVVVFIDEVDQLFQRREAVASTDSGVNRRILNGLLMWLGDKNRGTYVIGATNRVMDMDDAATRPGRFDEIVYVAYPDHKGRIEIFQVQCTKIHKLPVDKKLDYNLLASQSKFFSGAEIEKWCILAARQAMRANSDTITQEHFDQTLSQLSINVKERAAAVTNEIEQLKHLGNVNVPLMEASIQGLMAEVQEASGTNETRVESFTKNL
jgi:ATP-dependent 26S proteasome regulatory subunit